MSGKLTVTVILSFCFDEKQLNVESCNYKQLSEFMGGLYLNRFLITAKA